MLDILALLACCLLLGVLLDENMVFFLIIALEIAVEKDGLGSILVVLQHIVVPLKSPESLDEELLSHHDFEELEVVESYKALVDIEEREESLNLILLTLGVLLLYLFKELPELNQTLEIVILHLFSNFLSGTEVEMRNVLELFNDVGN